MLPSFGWTEMLMIAIVLIVVIGPRDALSMMRSVSQSLKSFRRMAGDMQRQFNEALEDADLGDIKDVAQEMRELDPRRQIKDALKPLEDTGRDLANDLGQLGDDVASDEPPAKTRSKVDRSLDDAGAKMREAQASIKPKAIVSLDDGPPDTAPAKKPTVKKPAAKKAAPRKPAVSKANGQAAKTTAAKKPAVKKPAAKKPAASAAARKRKPAATGDKA